MAAPTKKMHQIRQILTLKNEARFEYFQSELRKTGVMRLLLWEEYIKEQTDGYSYRGIRNAVNKGVGFEKRHQQRCA